MDFDQYSDDGTWSALVKAAKMKHNRLIYFCFDMDLVTIATDFPFWSRR